MTTIDLQDQDSSSEGGRLITWPPQPWWAWYVAAVTIGIFFLIAGVAVFANTDVGTDLRVRGCNKTPIISIASLIIGAFFLSIAVRIPSLQNGCSAQWSWTILMPTLPLPLMFLFAAMPGVMGCSITSSIASIAMVGQILVGTPGILLAGASATLCGAIIGLCLQINSSDIVRSVITEQQSIVDLAIQEADAFRLDAASRRFRGVDNDE